MHSFKIWYNWQKRTYVVTKDGNFCESGGLPDNVVPGKHLEWETELKEDLLHAYRNRN